METPAAEYLGGHETREKWWDEFFADRSIKEMLELQDMYRGMANNRFGIWAEQRIKELKAAQLIDPEGDY